MSYVTYLRVVDTERQESVNSSNIVLKNADGSTATAPTAKSVNEVLGGTITASTTPQQILVKGRRSGSGDTLYVECTSDSAQPVKISSNPAVSATGANRGGTIIVGGVSTFNIGSNGISLYVVTATGTGTVVWWVA